MSLTLWHRQFRNPIFLVLWTCYSEVQLVTSAAVSLLGALRAAWTFASSLKLLPHIAVEPPPPPILRRQRKTDRPKVCEDSWEFWVWFCHRFSENWNYYCYVSFRRPHFWPFQWPVGWPLDSPAGVAQRSEVKPMAGDFIIHSSKVFINSVGFKARKEFIWLCMDHKYLSTDFS